MPFVTILFGFLVCLFFRRVFIWFKRNDRKNLCIKVRLDQPFSQTYLSLRDTIEDTIIDRNLGDVWDVGMSETFMEINVECYSPSVNKIKSLIKVLGIEDVTTFELSQAH
jgi:hypothetical protein